MKLLNARGWAATVGTFALMVSGSFAATNCNLGATPCSGAAPARGCQGGPPPSAPIAHPTLSPCAGGGSFNFTGTQYATTCSNFGGSCASIAVPPFRFWAHDNYGGATGANSGCQILNATSDVDWFVNGLLDGLTANPAAAGRWIAYQANWVGPAIDGGAAGARTVIEASAPITTVEGTVNHSAWYMLASMSNVGGYDFDRITGVTGGCSAADVPTAPVPSVSIVGRTAACTGNPTATTGTNNAVDGTNYGDVSINISDVAGQWFSEGGRNAAPALITGFQIVYKAAPEPTSSVYATGGWLPVRDPGTPTMAMGLVPVGTAGAINVTLPKAVGSAWLAARVVYSGGAAVNPTGTFDPATAGPQVASPVGLHCGPVQFGGIITAVTFDSITATRTPQGVLVRWTTSFEDDVNGFVVYRTANPAGSTDSSDAVLPWASAHGPGMAYEFLDSGANGSDAYYYVIQEQTFSGPGASSAVVPAQGLSDGGTAGGRSRRH